MARGPELEELADEWDMPLISVEELLAYRDAIGDVDLRPTTPARLPTPFGEFTLRVYHGSDPSCEELALLEHPGPRKTGTTRQDRPTAPAPVVRLHSECLTGEAFHSSRCDCGAQLDEAMRRIAREGGAIVYLRQEGRGIGLFEKVRAYTLQDRGMDTLEANLALGHDGDERRFGTAAAVLKAAGYTRVRLLTNNPDKVDALERAGIEVVERLPLHVGETEANQFYLTTKFERMGHLAPETIEANQ
jgi:3,4-dihydroxy 2-butanone 4-phosphate synthase/GTP cyclohydrolase II